MPAQKFLAHDGSGGIQEVVSVQTGGAPSADKVPSLDANGRLDVTMMPSGVGADTSVVVASGALAAGDFVNLFNDGGTAKVRKADASSNVAPAHGFVLAAVTDGGNATVYWEGTNTAVTGQTPGQVFLSTTAGAAQAAAPSTSGQIVQKLGIAVSATEINFEPNSPILLA